jgi:hypothetical protein
VSAPRVLVVGGGLSGLAVAARLGARGGVRVDVTEAGRRPVDDHMNAVYSVPEIEERWRVPGADPTLWRPWDSATPPHYAGATGLRRQLGGRSLYWHGVVKRMDPWVLPGQPWPAGLAEDGGNRLYEPVERHLAEWTGGPLRGPRSATEQRLLSWTRSIGYPAADGAPLAVQRFDTGDGPRWRAYSPLYAGCRSVPAVRDQSDIGVALGQQAIAVTRTGSGPEVLLRDERTGALTRTAADAVVLAGGTIENTRIVAQMLDGPDRYPGLNDHILQGFVAYLPRSAWGAGGAGGSILLIEGDEHTRSNMFVKLLDGPAPGSVILNVWEMGEHEATEANAVGFPQRSAPPWRPVVTTGLSAADHKVVAGQHDRLQGFWDATVRALGLPPSTLDFGDFMTAPSEVTGFLDQAVAAPGTAVAYACTLGSLDHDAGTLPYGRVLTGDGEVAGAPGVYVVGPATFPRTGAANPSLTTLALAEHVANRIGSRLG